MKKTPVSLVHGVTGTVPDAAQLESALQDIQSGRYGNQIEQVRAAYRQGGKKAAVPIKKSLPAILFSGRFSERKDTGIQEHSGILVADLDEPGTDRITVLHGALAKDPHVVFLFSARPGQG